MMCVKCIIRKYDIKWNENAICQTIYNMHFYSKNNFYNTIGKKLSLRWHPATF